MSSAALATLDLDALREPLAADLGLWLPRQRWFAGKAREVAAVRVADVALIAGSLLEVLVEVGYEDGGTERYQVPLSAAGPDADGRGAVARLERMTLVDAVSDPDACRLLAALTLEPTRVPTAGGAELVGHPVGRPAPPEGKPWLLGAEQSNTSVVFGHEAILKLFRKLEPGVNPDVELTRALTEAASPHVPAQLGAVDVAGGDEEPTTLAVLSQFVTGGQEGWALATQEAASGDDTGLLMSGLGDLGRAVADTHAILADRFPTRLATAADVDGWVRAMQQQLDHVLQVAGRRAPAATARVTDRVDALRQRLSLDGLREAGRVQRIHGDLHLGQVLLDADEHWQLLDFEGEPARPLAVRREPHSVLRDVAGMLRSFSYAAAHAEGSWEAAARDRFLAGYVAVARPAGLTPADADSERVLLEAFELDKAVYELGYELANRPDWVEIPVRGILHILDG